MNFWQSILTITSICIRATENITDTAVKFIPLWILKYYGHCDVCVEIEPLSITKYQIFKVYLKNDNAGTEEQTDNKKQ